MKKEYLVSAEEMKQYDKNTIEKTGIPASVLMERASFLTASIILDYLNEQKSKILPHIVVAVGNGNNGADGVCIGRILSEYGMDVTICRLKSNHDDTNELKRQIEIAAHYPISFIGSETLDFSDYDVIVDAIFGVGLNRDIYGEAKEIIEKINESQAYKVSVDIPSGIDASTGRICGIAVKADLTVTFGFYKCGQFFYPGRVYCGHVKKVLIGINETSFYGRIPQMFSYFLDDKNEKLEFYRTPMGNKGTFGKVFVIAGRASTTGAAILCCASAFRSGCGMSAVLTEQDAKAAFLAALPEAMLETYTNNIQEEELIGKIEKWSRWCDTAVIGCGLGQDELSYLILKNVLLYCKKPIVVDADALQLFSKYPELYEYVLNRSLDENPLIFTPHPGELASLLQTSVSDIKNNRMQMISAISKNYPIIMAAKDADTICFMQENDKTVQNFAEKGIVSSCYLNTSGNDGMATAGSGDVLAGLIASILAQSMHSDIDYFTAVCYAVWLHGRAGDFMAEKYGKRFLVASDLIEAYKYILG